MRVLSVKWCSYSLGILLTLHSMASPALAGAVTGVPEIDGTSVAAGLGLLAAGVLILRARKIR